MTEVMSPTMGYFKATVASHGQEAVICGLPLAPVPLTTPVCEETLGLLQHPQRPLELRNRNGRTKSSC